MSSVYAPHPVVTEVRQWVRDAYALGLVPPDGEGEEMLDELALIVGIEPLGIES